MEDREMDEAEFRRIVEEEWQAVPDEWKARVRNVALLVEDEPSADVREQEGLEGEETLLGIYQGIPLTERGEGYGTGVTLPDTITVYRLPTLLEAQDVLDEEPGMTFPAAVQQVVRETIWHELGHYFGHGEVHLLTREDAKSNRFDSEELEAENGA